MRAVTGTSTPVAIALRQNAMASAGAAVEAMIGPDVDTAAIATTMTTMSVVGGTASAEPPGAVTRRVSRMDAVGTDALIEDAMKKSGLVWVHVRHERAQAAWHVWQDGAVYVLTGGIEQPAPGGLASVDVTDESTRAFVTARGKDTNGRQVTFETTVAIVAPGGEEWDAVVPALVAKRLNLPDHETAPQRWAVECTLWRLRPTGQIVETATDPSTESHAAAPPPTPARSRVPRPLHLRGRPARNRGGR